jgi:hypothetical protein
MFQLVCIVAARMLLNIRHQEEQFVKEFLRRGGLPELILVIESSHGNTLAVSVQTSILLDLLRGVHLL